VARQHFAQYLCMGLGLMLKLRLGNADLRRALCPASPEEELVALGHW